MKWSNFVPPTLQRELDRPIDQVNETVVSEIVTTLTQLGDPPTLAARRRLLKASPHVLSNVQAHLRALSEWMRWQEEQASQVYSLQPAIEAAPAVPREVLVAQQGKSSPLQVIADRQA